MDTYSSRTQPTGVTAVPNEANASAVSWAAVLAGAFVAAALTVTLVALGTGLGLSSVSPWSNAGVSATTIGVATIVWLILMQLVASATGGYLAGRLRTKWVDVHTDEVFFRDTAHGFLAWAVGIVIGAAFLASAAASLLGTAVQTAVPLTAAAGGAAAATAATSNNNSAGATGDRYSYYVDTMDGHAVARAIRAHAGEDIQLIALTGYGLAEDEQAAQAAGFDAHLVKPADMTRLRALLREGAASQA